MALFYEASSHFDQNPQALQKLVAKGSHLGLPDREGMTLVPLKLYFNDRGLAKLQVAIAKGKKTVDKRETVKKRDWDRQKARILKEHG